MKRILITGMSGTGKSAVTRELAARGYRARGPDGYGSAADERRKVSDLISAIEPLLRKSADHEIDTRMPVAATVDEILRKV